MFIPQQNNDWDEGDRERARRQQYMRIGLFVLLFFILFDGRDKSPTNSSKSSSSSNASVTKEQEIEDIRLPNSFVLRNVNAALTNYERPHAINITAVYKGKWRQSLLSDEGNIIMQYKSVPVKEVPGLLFVYGIIRLLTVSFDKSFPVQGVLLSGSQRLTMLSTPLKSQRLVLQLLTRTNESSQADPSKSDKRTARRRRKVVVLSNSSNPSSYPFLSIAWDPSRTSLLRLGVLESASASSSLDLLLDDIGSGNISGNSSGNSGSNLSLFSQAFNIELGEVALSPRFKSLQQTSILPDPPILPPNLRMMGCHFLVDLSLPSPPSMNTTTSFLVPSLQGHITSSDPRCTPPNPPPLIVEADIYRLQVNGLID